jgi:predicted transcriptional regulator
MSNAKPNHDPAFLGDLEREVLRIVWKREPVTAEVVRENLDRRLKESTIRTVLHRLEKKGYLRHSIENRTYVYQAVRAPRQVAAIAVKRIMDWLCDGSMEELMVGMVDIDLVDEAQLQQLSSKIAKARKGGK